MSNTTNEINRITTAIISISVKLIVYALIILLLYEAVTRGYAFGHEVFFAEAMEEKPGRDISVTIKPDTSVSEAAKLLTDKGLIKSEFAFIFQSKFYDYGTIYPGEYVLNTSMTSKEVLQALNVKPEGWGDGDSTKAQTSSNRLKTTDESGAQPASAQPASAQPADSAQTDGAASRSAGDSAAAAAADDGAAAADDGAAAAQTDGASQNTQAGDFSEDDEVGGWIEDATGGAGQ